MLKLEISMIKLPAIHKHIFWKQIALLTGILIIISSAGVTTQAALSCSTIGTNAFYACYFNDASPGAFSSVVFNRTDSSINFNWGTGSPDPSVNVDLFSARWTGNFTFTASNYQFTAVTDDGMRFYVDGVLVPFDQGDAWKDQAPTTYTATVP